VQAQSEGFSNLSEDPEW
jgi:hypothetical protein